METGWCLCLSATLAPVTVGSGGGEGVAKILTRDVSPSIYDGKRVTRALQDKTSFKKGQKDHQNELVYPLLKRGAKQSLPTVQVWQLPKRSPALLLRSKYNHTSSSSFCHNQLMRGQCGEQPACFERRHSTLGTKS